MSIKSSQKQDISKKRFVSPLEKETDEKELFLRPRTIDEYVGQKNIKKHLLVSIKSAKIRKEPLEHILFYGPPGLWKTTLSHIIWYEMWASVKVTSWPAIEKQADLVSLLTNMEEHEILFIDEIHRLRPQVEEILYTAMEDFTMDIMVWKWTWATSVRMAISPFTLIGSTTRLSSLGAPLRDRFWNVLKLDFYDEDEISKIIIRSAKILWINITDDIAMSIAKRSRRTPRVANRLIKIIRDYATIGEDTSSPEALESIFTGLNIDELGLDLLDKIYIETIYNNFAWGPVWLNTISSAIWEEESTIEDVVEPYLLQIGFLERTPRWRKITMNAIKHLMNKNKLWT